MISVNKPSFISPFSKLYTSYFFYCLIVLATDSSTLLNKSIKRGSPLQNLKAAIRFENTVTKLILTLNCSVDHLTFLYAILDSNINNITSILLKVYSNRECSYQVN